MEREKMEVLINGEKAMIWKDRFNPEFHSLPGDKKKKEAPKEEAEEPAEEADVEETTEE